MTAKRRQDCVNSAVQHGKDAGTDDARELAQQVGKRCGSSDGVIGHTQGTFQTTASLLNALRCKKMTVCHGLSSPPNSFDLITELSYLVLLPNTRSLPTQPLPSLQTQDPSAALKWIQGLRGCRALQAGLRSGFVMLTGVLSRPARREASSATKAEGGRCQSIRASLPHL